MGRKKNLLSIPRLPLNSNNAHLNAQGKKKFANIYHLFLHQQANYFYVTGRQKMTYESRTAS
jgi:hypothetical protein